MNLIQRTRAGRSLPKSLRPTPSGEPLGGHLRTTVADRVSWSWDESDAVTSTSTPTGISLGVSTNMPPNPTSVVWACRLSSSTEISNGKEIACREYRRPDGFSEVLLTTTSHHHEKASDSVAEQPHKIQHRCSGLCSQTYLSSSLGSPYSLARKAK
jgi:hypothetical protein